MNPELQRAQDMLAAMQAQRDNALNAMVMAQAELAMLRRRVSELEQDVSGLKEQLARATLLPCAQKEPSDMQNRHDGVSLADVMPPRVDPKDYLIGNHIDAPAN